MNVRRLFRLMLAIFVTAGLMIAPLAAPAVAAERAKPANIKSANMMQMADMGDMTADMTADMPCCPDKQKRNACQDCPLIAICMLQAFPAVPSGGVLLMRDPSHQRLHLLDDIIADGSARPPPDHPPRHLV
jgi:hypothetical protein